MFERRKQKKLMKAFHEGNGFPHGITAYDGLKAGRDAILAFVAARHGTIPGHLTEHLNTVGLMVSDSSGLIIAFPTEEIMDWAFGKMGKHVQRYTYGSFFKDAFKNRITTIEPAIRKLIDNDPAAPPAGKIVLSDGTKLWFRSNHPHREDGPAVEYPDGSRMWYRDGLRHRDDGPAVEWSDGFTAWYRDGKPMNIDEIQAVEENLRQAHELRERADKENTLQTVVTALKEGTPETVTTMRPLKLKR